MALILTLGPNGGTQISLTDATKHALAANGMRFTPHVTYDLRGLDNLDLVRLQAVSATQLEIALSLHFAGASQDALIANVREVADQIRRARLYHLQRIGSPVELTYKLPNATNPVVYDVLGGEIPPDINDYDILTNNLFDKPIKLYCQPWARAATQTVVSNTVGNYNYPTVSGIPGDMPALCRIRVGNFTGSTYDYVRVGIRSFGNVANFIARYHPGNTALQSGYSVLRGPRAQTIVTSGTSIGVQVAYNQVIGTNGAMEGPYNTNALEAEVVTNSGFEAAGFGSLTGWDPVGVNTSSSHTPGLSGSTADMLVGSGDGVANFRKQEVTVVPGVSYRFSCQMKSTSGPQPRGRGMKVMLSNVGISSASVSPPSGMDTADVSVNPYGFRAATSRVFVESTTTATLHTWDFIPSQSIVGIRIWYDGTLGSGEIDNISIKPIRFFAPGWLASSSAFYGYHAIDGTTTYTELSTTVNSEGETAGTRVKQGTAAQGIGQGDGNSLLYQTVTLGSNTGYRLRAYALRNSGTGSVVIGVTTNTGGIYFTTCQSAAFALCEIVFTTPAGTTSGTVFMYCEAATGGIVDSVSLVADDDANNELIRVTTVLNVADHYGNFAVYARVLNTGSPFELQVRAGGNTGKRSVSESITVPVAANPQMVQLGHIHIPGNVVPSSVPLSAISWGVWVVPAGMADVMTSATCQIYDLELCPIDEGFFEMSAATGEGPGIGEAAVLDCREPWTGVYLLDGTNAYKTTLPLSGGGRLTLPVGTVRFFVHACQLLNDPGSTNGFTVGVDYFARFAGPMQ